MLKNLKNAEYSKKLLVFIEVLIMAVFVLVCVSVCMGDSSPLTALITGTFTLASLSFGFYYWKAKNENIRKYAKTLNAEQFDKILKLVKTLNSESWGEDDDEESI